MDSTASIKSLRGILRQSILVQDDLDLYERYIVQIETNKIDDPNVAFEATKSLAEAIFRHVLGHEKIKVEFSEVLTHGNATTYDLFKACCKALADLGLIDIEVLGLGQKFFNDMSQIRNSVGIVSHGKDLRDVSDLRVTTVELAIANAINHILVILAGYEGLLEDLMLAYEENKEFNEFLDSEYEISGISYSKALYDQDPVAYNELLDEYNEPRREESRHDDPI